MWLVFPLVIWIILSIWKQFGVSFLGEFMAFYHMGKHIFEYLREPVVFPI